MFISYSDWKRTQVTVDIRCPGYGVYCNTEAHEGNITK